MEQKKEKKLEQQPDVLEPEKEQELDPEQLDKVAGGFKPHFNRPSW